MNKLYILVMCTIGLAIINSCSIEKRLHQPGFHISHKKNSLSKTNQSKDIKQAITGESKNDKIIAINKQHENESHKQQVKEKTTQTNVHSSKKIALEKTLPETNSEGSSSLIPIQQSHTVTPIKLNKTTDQKDIHATTGDVSKAIIFCVLALLFALLALLFYSTLGVFFGTLLGVICLMGSGIYLIMGIILFFV